MYAKTGEERGDYSNVVVFLDAVEGGNATTLRAAEHPTMASADRQFVPEVLPIVVHTTVDFQNHDTIYHNVFSKSKITPFDLGYAEHGESHSVTFDQTGLVKVYCDIHPQMIGYILVLNNSYFAVTDAQGHCVIREIPDGRYVVRAWQRFGPEQQKTVALDGAITAAINFELLEEKVSIQHTNKWGRQYEDTYRR